jgi:hypothetical protein
MSDSRPAGDTVASDAIPQLVAAAIATEPAAVRDFWSAAQGRVRSEGAQAVAELFPQLPRRLGRGAGPAVRVEQPLGDDLPCRVDLGALRTCDLAAIALVQAAGGGASLLLDLYRHGDLDEKIAASRCAAVCRFEADLAALLDEIHRQNVESLFGAGCLDSNLLARAAAHPGFGIDGFNRMVLKAAFVGLPLERILDARSRANRELSRMLQDLASEREAAGRAIWPDTLALAALAPCEGTVARIVGGIEHGDDRLRRAAANALLALGRRDLAVFAKERLPRETRPDVADQLRRAAAAH